MDWSSLVSTALGAVIGIASTLVTERVRWRRDHRERGQEANRQLYGEYLAALSRTWNEIRVISRNDALSAADRGRAAVDAFKAGGGYELRYQVSIVASDAIEEASVDAFRGLRRLRDLVEEGVAFEAPEYRQARVLWDERFARLRSLIRAEVGRAADD